MELMFQFLINVIIILHMVKLAQMYLSPTYVRELWDYKKANIYLLIMKAISNFDWNKAFENLSVDEKVDFLSKTLLNIFRNYIPNKKTKCD